MADSLVGDGRHLGSPKTKKSGQSLSGAWIVMLLSGLVAAVVFLFITNTANQKFSVLVAARDIPAGTIVDGSSEYFRQAEISTDDQTLGRMVKLRDRETLRGKVANGPIARGDLVMRASFLSPATSNNKFAMAIPIDKSRAVNGTLQPGDYIDIYDDGGTTALIQNAEVIDAKESSGGLGGGGSYLVLVGVSPQQAPVLSKAIQSNKINIARVTGIARQ